MKDKKSKPVSEGKELIEATLQRELIRLSKKQLTDRVAKLKRPGEEVSSAEITDYLTHELQVHQIELELQNRELRDAQRDLEITRDRYADLYDFAPISYMTFNEKGIIENINLTGSTMLDTRRDSIIGKPFLLWLYSDDVNRFYKHVNTVFKTNKKIIDEITLKIAGGKFIHVRIESVCSPAKDKKNCLCQSALIDITESKKAENAIHLQARQLKLIADSLPLQVAYLNAEEKHLFVNKTYIDWFGVNYSDVIGKTAYEFWSDKYYLRAKSHLNLAYTGRQVTFDMKISEDDSTMKYISVTLIPDYDMDHLVCGIIILIGDITDRLSGEMVDRQRLLDAAHFSKLNTMGEMASEIAHELNQPLAAISIYSDACKRLIMSDALDTDLIKNTLSGISEQAERAGEIIRHIRSLVSKKELMLTSMSVNDLISSSMELLAIELRSHNIQLIVNFDDAIPIAYIDKVLIEQVIINLSRNAIDAMESTVTTNRVLKIESSLANAAEFQICISDTGSGLTKKQMDTMFQPFNSTKKDGMGLGLVICQSIIDAHHGRLWVDSIYDGGTKFCFCIPLIPEDFHNDG